ncbi:hypothetical protein NHX12_025620, partial [Muraenolepis orangiensis]
SSTHSLSGRGYSPSCLSPCLSPYLSPCLSPCLSPYLSPCLSPYLSSCLSPYLSPYLSPCLSPYLSPCLSPCLSPYLSTCLSPYLSPCLSPYLSPCLSPYLSPCLSSPPPSTLGRRCSLTSGSARGKLVKEPSWRHAGACGEIAPGPPAISVGFLGSPPPSLALRCQPASCSAEPSAAVITPARWAEN